MRQYQTSVKILLHVLVVSSRKKPASLNATRLRRTEKNGNGRLFASEAELKMAAAVIVDPIDNGDTRSIEAGLSDQQRGTEIT